MGFSMLFFMVIVVALSRGVDPIGDPDGGPVPGLNDPGDEDDEPANKGDWNKRNKGKRPPRDFDDDGF
jgi:hypothetical protein